MIDGQNNHDWVRCSPVMIDTLKATGKFEIERATVTKSRVAEFSPDFTKYHVILSNYNGDSWPEKTKSEFVKYVKEGGNLVVVHAADNSFPNWKEYNEMIGLALVDVTRSMVLISIGKTVKFSSERAEVVLTVDL